MERTIFIFGSASHSMQFNLNLSDVNKRDLVEYLKAI